MIDINLLRKNPQLIRDNLKKRASSYNLEEVIALDEKLREINSKLQKLQAQRNNTAELIGKLKRENQEHPDLLSLNTEAESVKKQLAGLPELSTSLEKELNYKLSLMPNILQDEVPYGKSDEDNIMIKSYKEPTQFSFDPRHHYEIKASTNLLDFETGVKLSGSRFNVMSGSLARMERALANFMLDVHTAQFGFIEYAVPHLVKEETMIASSQLPYLKNDMFSADDNLYLIPTAEVALVNIVRDSMIAEEKLPLRFTAYSQCFRKEAGASGADTKGLIRQRQFSKVELVSIVESENANAEHEYILNAAEKVLQLLDLPYKIMQLCSGDTGFSSQKTYDIEVWLPGEKRYREISSCSNVGDFQARRMKTKIKYKNGNKSYPYTLNGSGLAIGRTIVAIMENYQNENGSISIPQILIPYMGGLRTIETV